MEQQSKAFHIWKAVEMAAKERVEASSSDDNADVATLKYIQKLLSDLEDDINGDNLIFKLLKLHAEQNSAPRTSSSRTGTMAKCRAKNCARC